MAPNSSVKTAAVRPLSELINCKKENSDLTLIRTDFVLQNIFSYLIKNVRKFDAVRPSNSEEENLIVELKEIVDEFKYCNGEKIGILCTQVEITMEKLSSTLYGVSDELFNEGITWSRIIALFVFVAYLTLQGIERNQPEEIVDAAYGYFCCYVKENVKPWVDHHGGWSDILTLKKAKPVGWTTQLKRNIPAMFSTLINLSNLPY